MISPEVRQQLLDRIPFLFGIFKKEEVDILMFKWGSGDKIYHSSKSTAKRLKLDIPEEKIKELERKAITEIDKEIDHIYTCPECGSDIRKCGLWRTITGHQRTEIYISSYGSLTREKEPIFQKENYSSRKSINYRCMRCDRNFGADDPITLFLENRMTPDAIIAYMSRFKGISPQDIIQYKNG